MCGCSEQRDDNLKRGIGNQARGVSQQFQTYWNRSRESGSDVNNLITLDPMEFWHCRALTELECVDKLKEESSRKEPAPGPNQHELVIEPSEIVANQDPVWCTDGILEIL